MIPVSLPIAEERSGIGATLETPTSARWIELLASAERPVIVAGGGVLRARTSTDLVRFAELLQVPVDCGLASGGRISNDHPLYLGMAGLGAALQSAPAARGRRHAGLGCRLTRRRRGTTRPTHHAVEHVDIDPIARSFPRPPDLTVTADARSSCGRRMSASSAGPSSMPRGSQAAGTRDPPGRMGDRLDRPSTRLVDGSGRPSRPGHHYPPRSAPRRRVLTTGR